MITLARLWVSTFGLLFCLDVARADRYEDYMNSVSKKPFVPFLARASDPPVSLTGHAFVAVGMEIDNGVKVYRRIFGFYPQGREQERPEAQSARELGQKLQYVNG